MKISDIIFSVILLSVVAFFVGYIIGSLEQEKADARLLRMAQGAKE
jgi:hypothetical protein